METVNKNTLSRRTLAKGALWSAPVLAASSTVPSYAASKPRPAMDIGGFISLTKDCSSGVLKFAGSGRYPRRGLWVVNADETSQATHAKITYYFPSAYADLRWKANASNGAWSLLSLDSTAPQQEGFVAYSTTFAGSWRYRADHRSLIATTGPSFEAHIDPSICQPKIEVYNLRTVIVDGEQVSAMRGPVVV